MTGQQTVVFVRTITQQAQRFIAFRSCCSLASYRFLYIESASSCCSVRSWYDDCLDSFFSASKALSYVSLNAFLQNLISKMSSREATNMSTPSYRRGLYIGAMDREELSRVQMVGQFVWTGKSASVAHFICLSPTDSEFAPLRYLV